MPATDFEISLNNSILGAVRNLASKYENCINNFIYSQNYFVGNNPENMSSFKLAILQTKVKKFIRFLTIRQNTTTKFFPWLFNIKIIHEVAVDKKAAC